MATQPNGKPMPRSIDEPDQVLLWSVDELIPVAVVFGVGIFIHQLTIAVCSIYFCVKLYRRYRDGRPLGFTQHFMYWYGFSGKDTVTIRNPYIVRFLP